MRRECLQKQSTDGCFRGKAEQEPGCPDLGVDGAGGRTEAEEELTLTLSTGRPKTKQIYN